MPPTDQAAVLHVRQLTAAELDAVQAAKKFFKESAWDEWRTTRPLKFDRPNDAFEVDADFATDLVSVPGAVAWFVPRAGRYARAAVLHDYLWRYPDRTGCDRRQADYRFRLQMQRDGVSLLRRWIIWSAVRLSAIAQGKGGEGWPKDLPGALLLVLFVAAPIIVVPALTILLATVVFWVLESAVALVVPDEAPTPIQLKT
ncbi:DUF1353 domain-containing protein [Mycolicibacterium flavescens]|uniref:DUF1353 domain-containing protein n=1 Tax=Mycolicibacterium flavescens TaxID=1776 RepID=A0A1E3RHR2_MYCFV|nr:DUF1353 domain-containing protein [Mycolicibacterium flavescens]MCV7280339.1 DUF1353 domain-containing protein [Mycolicibacterium flavescens]ODQ89415.1 hypothetical protein BHQ18_15710 [Mycolicibacterium flavescens]